MTLVIRRLAVMPCAAFLLLATDRCPPTGRTDTLRIELFQHTCMPMTEVVARVTNGRGIALSGVQTALSITGQPVITRTTGSGGLATFRSPVRSHSFQVGATHPGFSPVLMAWTCTSVPRFGFQATHIYTLRIPPGGCPHPNPALTGCDNTGDTLPVGTNIFYMFGVFDTGSTVVLINNINRANGRFSDAQALALCRAGAPCQTPTDPFLPRQLDSRIWGLSAVDPMTTNAPLAMPQFEVAGVQVRPYATRDTVIGAPVAARAIALIDYSTTVSRSYPFLTEPVQAPDITFFGTGDPMIPNAPYVFSLTQTGTFGAATDGASTGPRFLMPGASFRYNGRTASGTTFRILYDTGNQTTQVTERMAQALGIRLGSTPAVDRITIGTLDAGDVQMQGFAVDRFELVTADGANRFRVNRPMLYVRPNRADGSNPFPSNIDGVFGSNYFWERRVIFNGPASTLGMFNISPINP